MINIDIALKIIAVILVVLILYIVSSGKLKIKEIPNSFLYIISNILSLGGLAGLIFFCFFSNLMYPWLIVCLPFYLLFFTLIMQLTGEAVYKGIQTIKRKESPFFFWTIIIMNYLASIVLFYGCYYLFIRNI